MDKGCRRRNACGIFTPLKDFLKMLKVTGRYYNHDKQ